MTAAEPGRRREGDRARAGATLATVCLLLLTPVGAGTAGAFDPGVVSLSQGYETADPAAAAAFRLALEDNLTACAWADCEVTRSDEVNVTVTGPDRIGGTTVATYGIDVSGVEGFEQNYTTIAVVLTGDTTNVQFNTDESAELAGNVAYTKLLEGSSSMEVNVIGPNATGDLKLYVFGYVGNGDRLTHGQEELYHLEEVSIKTRPTRFVPLNVTVGNAQNVSVTGVPVSFFVKGPADANYEWVGDTTIPTIVANGEAYAAIDWDATWAEDTVYTVKAVIDPEHVFPETREDNNVRFFQVNLGPESDAGPEEFGELFGYGVIVVFVAVVTGIWWYNRRYE